MAEPLRHRHVIGLDLLRLLAASLVLYYHAGFWNWTRGQPLALALPGQAPAWGERLHFGWVGVEIFFVISGFVIAYTASDAQPAAFLRSRFLRLAPVNWIGATMVLLILLALGEPAGGGLALRYVETLVFWPLNAIQGVWWTLGIEVDFYLLTYLLIRRGLAHRLEAVMIPVGLASGLFWIAALSLAALLDGQTGSLGLLRTLVMKAQANRELQLLLVQHGCLFATGIVLWKASVDGLTRRRAMWLSLLAGACLLEIVGENGIISRASQIALSAAPAMLAWGMAMTLFALCIVANTHLARLLGRWTPAVRFAGMLTYPLYLLHNTIIVGAAVALAPRFGNAAVVVGEAAAFAAAAFVAGPIEPRLRRALARRLPRLPARPSDQRPDGSAGVVPAAE